MATKVLSFAAQKPAAFFGIVITVAVILFIAFGHLSADAKPLL